MVDYIKKRFARGTIFYFPGYGDYFILAQMGDALFNLISLTDGNRKTTSWSAGYPGGILDVDEIRIPEYTWLNGGPPEVVFNPTPKHRNLREVREFIDNIKNHVADNLNKDLIDAIKKLL